MACFSKDVGMALRIVNQLSLLGPISDTERP